MPLLETKGAASAQGFGEFAQQTAANYIEDVFSTWLYTGNGSTQTITNGIDLSTKGGLVWVKNRSGAYTHVLVDTVRGTDKVLCSNNANAEQTGDPGFVTQFNTNGFAIGDQARVNLSSSNFASWTFRKQPKFFDVVTYTGNGTAGRTVAHSLGSVPGCMIVKCTSNPGGWNVYHRSLGATKFLYLDSTLDASNTNAWNSTAPTSTVFTVGGSGIEINDNGRTYIAYLFAHDAGGFGLTGTDNVISCGSFTVDGSGNSSINLGYEPQWLLMKQTNTTGSWLMQDTMRGQTADNGYARLLADTSGAETSTTTGFIRINATGFSTNGATGLVGDHIYIAIRRGPMKTPTTGTSVFAPDIGNNVTGSGDAFTAGFPIDAILRTRRSDGVNLTYSRLTGTQFVRTYSTAAETTDAGNPSFASMTGFLWPSTSDFTGWIGWMFRRAPGFFDVVCYTGQGSGGGNIRISHNLGAVPEMIIVKDRAPGPDPRGYWNTYHASLGNNSAVFLNTTDAVTTTTGLWGNNAPSSTTFGVGNTAANYQTSSSGQNYVAYLFASCPGVSKVFSFTGNGSSQTINCGFTGGSRLVLIKRTDSTGNWVIFDSARGIVAGNDPALYLNSTAAEVTGVDAIDTDSTGFIVNQETTFNLNVNNATYIGLAIS